MKTLDEVIDELEDEGVFPDALHYLKEYRKLDSLDNIAFREDAEEQTIYCPNCGDGLILLPESNDPLSWEELQQMTGKPVWIEVKQGFIDFRGWILIERTAEVDMLCLTAELHSEFIVDGDDMGYTWNAYRKERS